MNSFPTLAFCDLDEDEESFRSKLVFEMVDWRCGSLVPGRWRFKRRMGTA
jgi:hypothetical protein